MENQPSVVIYTSKKCEESALLRQVLKENGIEFRDRNIDADYDAREYMNNMLKANNKTPAMTIGKKTFIGFVRNRNAIKKELQLK
jgi:glutaredoxin